MLKKGIIRKKLDSGILKQQDLALEFPPQPRKSLAGSLNGSDPASSDDCCFGSG